MIETLDKLIPDSKPKTLLIGAAALGITLAAIGAGKYIWLEKQEEHLRKEQHALQKEKYEWNKQKNELLLQAENNEKRIKISINELEEERQKLDSQRKEFLKEQDEFLLEISNTKKLIQELSTDAQYERLVREYIGLGVILTNCIPRESEKNAQKAVLIAHRLLIIANKLNDPDKLAYAKTLYPRSNQIVYCKNTDVFQ
jgi:DNA gyrase/topoisomerase IV subunit A